MKKFFAYVLKSEMDGRLYKGSSDNIGRRVKEHNAGKMKSTKGFRPWKLAYIEEFDTFKEARDREKYFKTGSGREFIKYKIGLVAQLDRVSDYGSEG